MRAPPVDVSGCRDAFSKGEYFRVGGLFVLLRLASWVRFALWVAFAFSENDGRVCPFRAVVIPFFLHGIGVGRDMRGLVVFKLFLEEVLLVGDVATPKAVEYAIREHIF